MTKNEAIRQMILAKMARGMTVDQALDAVCGPGTFAKLAEDTYHAIRAKA